MDKNKYNLVFALREQGKTYREIAEVLGETRRQVQDYCKIHKELQYDESERSSAIGGGWNKGTTVVDWDKRVHEVLDGRFKLVSRILTDSGESRLTVKCTTCGAEKEISSISLRGQHPTKISCGNCSHLETEQRHKQKREFEQWQTKLRKEADKNRKSVQIGMNFCDCGKIIPNGTKYCEDCGRRRIRSYERNKETKRRMRLKTQGFDKTITLEKLYDRDNGVCYLCNRTCDWSDFQKVNGVFIVGGSYPTVEHIKPLCKGGEHSWSNVKLACFSCNTKKGAKLMPPSSE